MDVEWDPTKAKANQRRHRVRFADAATVFDDPMIQTIPDPDSEGEARYISFGYDLAGRALVVAWTVRGHLIRIISARRASPGEAKRLGR
jgi:uncharacterized DUF497 family protein